MSVEGHLTHPQSASRRWQLLVHSGKSAGFRIVMIREHWTGTGGERIDRTQEWMVDGRHVIHA